MNVMWNLFSIFILVLCSKKKKNLGPQDTKENYYILPKTMTPKKKQNLKNKNEVKTVYINDTFCETNKKILL